MQNTTKMATRSQGFIMIRFIVGLAVALCLATSVQAQSGYGIQPGDVIQVDVLEDASLNRNALVLPDGSINFPLVGTIQAGGRTAEAVQAAIASSLASNFAAPPTVFVSVRSLGVRPEAVGGGPAIAPGISVYIVGEAASPGKKSVTPGTTLLQFLAEAGGVTKFAATKRIQLRRTDPKSGVENVYTFNYRAVQAGAASRQTIVLAPGDVIVVPERRLFE